MCTARNWAICKTVKCTLFHTYYMYLRTKCSSTIETNALNHAYTKYQERPTPHYSVKRHLNLNDCDAFLIWTSTQVVQKCCFHNQHATLQVGVARLRLRVLVMKTTLLDHLSLGPYKESVTSVQIQMLFHAVGRSFRPSGGSYAPDNTYDYNCIVT